MLPCCLPTNTSLPDGLSIVGLGQLGQAYLSLLYFLTLRNSRSPYLVLLDKDPFELPNQRTQVLLEEHRRWDGQPKADYVASRACKSGAGEYKPRMVTEVNWGWKRPTAHPPTGLLGLDDLDVRRMAVGRWV